MKLTAHLHAQLRLKLTDSSIRIHDVVHNFDRLCGLVVRVPGCRMHMYCASCEVRTEFICYVEESRPPLWSSCQGSWLQIQRSRVRLVALPDVLRSSGSAMGSTQPREYT
jgi:hypothetical protein